MQIMQDQEFSVDMPAQINSEVSRFLAGYSLEATAKDLPAVTASAHWLAAGTRIAVPYLPGQALGELVAAAAGLRALGFEPVPHVSARRLNSADELSGFLAALRREAAVNNVFVVAGDLAKPIGPFADALAVINSGLLPRFGIRQAGIAGYPEGHAAIPSADLWRAMMDKRAAIAAQGLGCDIVTQFAFEAAPVLDWLAALRARGITETVRIGIPGPASASTLLKYAARCGVNASARAMKNYGLSLGRLIGTAGPDQLVADLAAGLTAAHGNVATHFFPFGGVEKSAAWAAAALARHAAHH